MKGGSYNALVECLYGDLLREEKQLKKDIDLWSSSDYSYSSNPEEARKTDKQMTDIILDRLAKIQEMRARLEPLRGAFPFQYCDYLWSALLEVVYDEVSAFAVRLAEITERYRREFLSEGKSDRYSALSMVNWGEEIKIVQWLVGRLQEACGAASQLVKFQEEKKKRIGYDA